VTEAEAIEAILEQWETGWELLHPEDPSDPDHVAFTFDNEAALSFDTWVRFSIVHTVRHQATMAPKGSRKFMSQGYIAVQIFVTSNTGTQLAAELADDVRTVLESTETIVAGQPLSIYAGSTTGNTTDGRWLMRVVTLPFTYWAAG
jgi:hypothetical protein